MSDAAKARADYVRALEEERAGYVMRGLPDRVAEVDKELARFGEAPIKRAPAKKAKVD